MPNVAHLDGLGPWWAADLLLTWPVCSGFDGERITHSTRLRVNGWWAIPPMTLPVVIAFVTLVFRKPDGLVLVQAIALPLLGAGVGPPPRSSILVNHRVQRSGMVDSFS
jgi:hypothetical protein